MLHIRRLTFRYAGHDDPAGADGGHQSVLPANQVLAVPAAGPGDARRLSARPTTRCASRTSTCSGWTSPMISPDLVVIQAYITSARRSYELADAYRARGRLRGHRRPARHVLAGRGRRSTPTPSSSGRARTPGRCSSTTSAAASPGRGTSPPSRTLDGLPPIRRDLIQRDRYLVPNSIVVSRGCPHHCDFCYKDAFFEGGKSFYTQTVDAALAEIDRLPGRHLYFLDDHLFGNRRFADGAVRRHARRRPGLAGGRHRRLGPRARAAGAGGRRPACAASSSASRRSTRAICAGQRKRQNMGRDYARRGAAAARRRRDGERELRLRHGRRRPGRLRPHRRLGGRARASRRRRSTS